MLNPVLEQLWQLSWQAAAVAIFVLPLRAVFGRTLTARWRHMLWLPVLGRLMIPVLPESRFSIFTLFGRERSAPQLTALPDLNLTHTTVNVEYGPIEKLATTPPSLLPQHQSPFWKTSTAIESVWLAGVIVILLRLVVTNARFASRLRKNSQCAPAHLTSLLNDCLEKMRIASAPGLITTDMVDSPAVTGILHPRILLPTQSIETLNESQLRLVLLHELSHIKCRDVAMDWLWAILQSLHWFNPILWLIAPLRRADREQARDEMVLQITGAEHAGTYGQTLLSLATGSTRPIFCPGMVGILGGKYRLRRRIERIASLKNSRTKATWFGVGVIIVSGCCALTNPRTGSQPAVTQPAFTNETALKPIPESSENIETSRYDDSLKKTLGDQTSIETRFITFEDAELRNLPKALQHRCAAFAGAGKDRTDQMLTADETNQIIRAEQKASSVQLTAPRLTLFEGQHCNLHVATEQAYVSSLTPVSAPGAALYDPQVSTIDALGVDMNYSVRHSPDGRVISVDVHSKLSKLLALVPVTIKWPDPKFRVQGTYQVPVMVKYDRALICAVPDKTTLLLGMTPTFESGHESATTQPVAVAAIEKAIEQEGHRHVYLLIKPTIIPSTGPAMKSMRG